MADPSRFRHHRDGPLASAMYNQRWKTGCLICKYNIKTKGEHFIRLCSKSVKGFPHMTKFDCQWWDKSLKRNKETSE